MDAESLVEAGSVGIIMVCEQELRKRAGTGDSRYPAHLWTKACVSGSRLRHRFRSPINESCDFLPAGGTRSIGVQGFERIEDDLIDAPLLWSRCRALWLLSSLSTITTIHRSESSAS